MVFTSFSYSSNINRSPDAHNQIINNFGDLLQGLLGNIAANRNSPLNSPPLNSPPLRPRDPHRPQQPQQGVDPMLNRTSQFFPPQNGTRSPVGPPMMGGFQQDDGGMQAHPLLNMMRMVLSGHPAMMNGHGDAAYSQDDFDRIMSQLLDQAQQGGGEPPASQQEIARIPKVTVDQDWLDRQEHKECTICMEEAKLGDEISELWCRHWYHPFCIKQWLDAHGACPLCRKTLQQGREEWEAKNAESPKRERRRSSKQHTHSHNSYDPRGYRDEGGSSGSSGGGGDAGNSSGGGIRDRISRFLGSNG